MFALCPEHGHCYVRPHFIDIVMVMNFALKLLGVRIKISMSSIWLCIVISHVSLFVFDKLVDR